MVKIRLLRMVVVVLALTILPDMVQAAFYDFESDHYTYEYNDGCLAAKSADRAYEGDFSGKLSSAVNSDYGLFGAAKIIIMPFNAPLDKTSLTYYSFIAPGSMTYAPYAVFGIDTNNNGTLDDFDSIVLAAGTEGNQTGQWFQNSLDANTLVHVIRNRNGLEDGTYTLDNPGTFGSLCSLVFSGSATWGDLNIIEVRLQAGCWPADPGDTYTAYVDNLTVAHVPVPGAVWLLGTGLVGLGLLRFRRKKL